MNVKLTDFGAFNHLSRSDQRDCKTHVVPRTLKQSALDGGLITEQAPFLGCLSACVLSFYRRLSWGAHYLTSLPPQMCVCVCVCNLSLNDHCLRPKQTWVLGEGWGSFMAKRFNLFGGNVFLPAVCVGGGIGAFITTL